MDEYLNYTQLSEKFGNEGWAIIGYEEENGAETIHCIPLGDMISHEPVDCVCLPANGAMLRSDGSYGWMAKHHSLDGRELEEE